MNISMRTLVDVLDLLVYMDKTHLAGRICDEACDMTHVAYRFVSDETKSFINSRR